MIELIGVLMLAISPWILKGIMNIVKFANSFKVGVIDEDRKPVLRFILAVLTFAVAIVHTMLTGEPVPQTAIDAAVAAVSVFAEWAFLWLSTTGLYLLSKNKAQ
jgi:hypothetical protein